MEEEGCHSYPWGMTSPYPTPNVLPAESAASAAPAYAPAVSDNRTLGILSLIGGIASIVFGQTVVVPVAAIVLGFLALQRETSTRAFAIWGIVLGIVALFGWVFFAILGVVIAAPFFFIGAF